eukprot:5804067-Pyramimonas_sp.AAC.1
MPSAVKFHYQWNLRELTNVAQGMCRMIRSAYSEPLDAVRLWVHEVERVFLDRLINETDSERFTEIRTVSRDKHI